MLRKIFLAVSLVLALTPFVLFPVCDTLKPDGTHMACWYSGILITSMGAAIFILSLPKTQSYIRLILTLCAALVCWLVPNRIIAVSPFGLCGDVLHACRANTMIATGGIVSVLVMLSFVGLVMTFIRGDK